MGVRRRSWQGVRGREAGPVDLPSLVRALPGLVAAEKLAAALLVQAPCRLRHVRTAAAVALDVSVTLPPDRFESLLASVVLHDIGYAELVRDTGFHPLDGASWLARLGAPPDVVAAVAHHSEAVLQPSAAPFLDRYAGLPRPAEAFSDVVTYADQTTAPDGRRVGLVDRLRERAARHPAADDDARVAQRVRVERLVHAVARVDARLARSGSRDAFLESIDPGLVHSRPRSGDADVARLRSLPAPRGGDGLDPDGRLRAAVHAARLLQALGGDALWEDPTATADRLLAAAVPSGPAVAPHATAQAGPAGRTRTRERCGSLGPGVTVHDS